MIAVLTFVLLALASSQAFVLTQSDAKIQEITEECSKEHKIDISALDKADPSVFEGHENKCFAHCVYLKAGLVTEEGNPNVEEIRSLYKISDSHPIFVHIKQCGESVEEGDVCDRFFEIKKCVVARMTV